MLYSRRFKVATVVIACLGVIGGLYLYLALRNKAPFKMADVTRLQKGLTEQEVNAILGPPGDYSRGDIEYTPAVNPRDSPLEQDLEKGVIYSKTWLCNDGYIIVYFDAQQKRVTGVGSVPAEYEVSGIRKWLREIWPGL